MGIGEKCLAGADRADGDGGAFGSTRCEDLASYASSAASQLSNSANKCLRRPRSSLHLPDTVCEYAISLNTTAANPNSTSILSATRHHAARYVPYYELANYISVSCE